jgi:hypothetical protein
MILKDEFERMRKEVYFIHMLEFVQTLGRDLIRKVVQEVDL